MPIIRKRLDAAQVGTPGYRYDATTDTFEYQLPDLTWVDDPSYPDPRITNIVPPRTGGAPQCDAAASLTRWTEDFIDTVVNALTLGVGAFGIASTTLGLLLRSFNILWALAVDLGLAIVAEAVGILGGAFSSTVFDQLECIFFCNMDSVGFIDAPALAEINTQIDDEIGGVPAIILHVMFDLMGFAGMNSQGALGTETGDCDGCACAWCYTWDLTVDAGNWAIYPGQPGTLDGAGFNTGLAFVSPGRGRTQTIVQMTEDLTGYNIDNIIASVHATLGTVEGGEYTVLGVFYNNFATNFGLSAPAAGDFNIAGAPGGSAPTASIEISFCVGGCASCGDPGGHGEMYQIQMTGVGERPPAFFGGFDC